MASIGGHRTKIIVDTGASTSVASASLMKKGAKLLPLLDGDPREAEGFEGSRTPIRGRVNLRLEVENLPRDLEVAALVPGEMTDDMLLGSDVLLQYGMVVDIRRRVLEWKDGCIPLEINSLTRVTRLCRTSKLHPETQTNTQMRIAERDGTVVVIEAIPGEDRGFVIPSTVATVRKGLVRVPVLCVNTRGVKLNHREAIAQCELVPDSDDSHITTFPIEEPLEDILSSIRAFTSVTVPDGVKLAMKKLGTEITAPQRQLLLNLLLKYQELFDDTLGTCDISKHVIDTGDSRPIHLPRRRYSQVEEKHISEEIETLLKKGVIERSTGPWAAAVVLVKKKDGSWRFCVDYRAVNKVTVKDKYPLPRIDEALDQLGKNSIFTTLDMNSGFWQLSMDEKSKAKTAFLTKDGLFQFLKMPFGLSNSPGTFQRVMDLVLRGLTWKSCLVYIDDIIIYSKTFAEHLVHLAQVFAALTKAGLRLSAKKTILGAHEVDYLGFRVGRDGLKPQDGLVKAVRDFPTPTDASSIKRFVHMAGFYRRFIPGFAQIAGPLQALLKNDVVFNWGVEENNAFQKLKDGLVSKPCLVLPDFELPFTLATDAAQTTGMGAALMQDQGNGLQPIAYWSRALTDAQKRYGVSESECLAIVESVKIFRPYLYGRKFTLETDHQALTWLMSKQEPAGKLSRWALELQEYDMDIVYRKGCENVVADALSRDPIMEQKEEMTASLRSLRIRGLSALQLCPAIIDKAQRSDDWVQKHVGIPRHRDRHGNTFKVVRRQNMWQARFKDETHRILLPSCLRHEVLKGAHDSAYGGHFAARRTEDRVEEIYVMDQISKHVREWVLACAECGCRKVQAPKVVPPLRPLDIGGTGDRYIIDLFGPFTGTPRGNKYLLVMMEYVSRMNFVEPIKDRYATTIAAAVWKVLHQFGIGRELVSDNAGELAGNIAKELCALGQMRLSHPTPHHHQMTGLIDRFGRTFGDMMSKFINQIQDDWDLHCHVLSYTSNTASNRSSSLPPYTVMFGRTALTPDMARLKVSEPFSKATQRAQAIAQKVAHEEIALAQEAMTVWYEKKVRSRWQWKKDDQVWLFWPGTTGPHVGKLRARWRGPYTILNGNIGHDNVLLEHSVDKERLIAHVSFLQRYHTRENLLEEEAEKLAEAEDHAREFRVTRGATALVYVIDEKELDVIVEKKVRNASGKPEVRFCIQEEDGKTRWTDVDGKEPPKFGKNKKRMPLSPPPTRRHPGGSLGSVERPSSVFGRDVPSLFEDVDDGSRGSRPLQ